MARRRVDTTQLALVAFPGAVPQLAFDPGHASDEAIGFDRPQYFTAVWIDAVDLAVAVLPDPQHAFGPGQPRIATFAGRGDRVQELTRLGVQLLDHAGGDLKQVPAIEGSAGVGRDRQAAPHLARHWLERLQVSAGRQPHQRAVERDTGHVVSVGKRPVFAHDLGFGHARLGSLAHGLLLPQRAGRDE